MRPHRDLDVLDAAELVVAEVNELIDSKARRLLHKVQLRDSAESVSANIAEGFGRATRADRDRALVVARGEAEETIRHLRSNLRARRIEERVYWPLHNRLVTIVKMLNAHMY